MEALLRRRLTGESVARIIGEREFYGLGFTLNAATLEPRPETELLVDMAIAELPKGGQLLDLGTGTGCIPISVLVNRRDVRAIAVDLSGEALVAARHNAERHRVEERIAFHQGSWFEPLPAQDVVVDLIVSNPPYIATSVLDTLDPEVKDFDPRLALDGGPDGLAPYRIIAQHAANYLTRSGMVMVEIGFDQGPAVEAVFRQAGFDRIEVRKDLNNLDRVVIAHHLQHVGR